MERYLASLRERGAVGVVYFPAEFAAGRIVEVLSPQGVEVRQTPADDPGAELVHPAGEPFIPPRGRWRTWLQGGWSMTPHSQLHVTPSGPWRELLPRFLHLAPAGRVGVDADASAGLELASEPELWLLSASTDREEGGSEMSRRRSVSEVGDGVLMPVGTTLAGLRDRESESYVALSRPFEVPAGTTVPVPLERPAPDVAWLVSYVRNPRLALREDLTRLELTVEVGERVFRPDFAVRTLWGQHAVWYGLPPGPAVLAGGGDRLYLEPQTVELAGGEIGDFHGDLLPRPSLYVSLVLARLLRQEPLHLEVRRLPAENVLTAVELGRNAGRHRFDRLEAGVLEVVLRTHLGPFRDKIELDPGEEGFLLLEPKLIELWGTVRHDGDPHPATLEFQMVTGDAVEARAGEAGEYRAFALHPVQWLTVELEREEGRRERRGLRQEPWRDAFMPPIRSSRELDVDIPDVETLVRVVDAATGRGIPGAGVAVRNEYSLPLDGAADEHDGDARYGRDRAVASSATTDGDGWVSLPPPRPGRLEIRASAAGAEVMRVGVLPGDDVLFAGRADAAGVVEVPADPSRGHLLLRHPAAASCIVDWPALANAGQAAWSFPRAAGRPLTLRALDPSGRDVAPGAGVTVWLGTERLSGPLLRWLLEAPQRTDRDGFWTARRLPAAPLRLLVWRREALPAVRAGTLDTLATAVPFPWPETVEVRAVR